MRLDRIEAAPLQRDPFDYVFIPATLDETELPEIVRDFPEVPSGGSYDVTTLACGPAFEQLIGALRADDFRAQFEKKFEIDLSPFPFHVTVRGHVRGRDGGIHTDSKDKILTGLLYLNPVWTETGGRLRLLRNGRDIENYACEVPPVGGNMVVFRRGDASWHGHLPSQGRRLSLQFNWVSGEEYARRELARHRFSGKLKRLFGRAPAAGVA
ncbi:MAG TPA: 2OG-Fe(II) oxygenase [Alphaproteobacteria bacterium]|nr:2OG-Fe(II) oxygenase [Alphaproteobacteria bacterium]